MTDNRNPSVQTKPDLAHILNRRRQTLEGVYGGLRFSAPEFETWLAELRKEYTVSKETENTLYTLLVPVLSPKPSKASPKKAQEPVQTTDEAQPQVEPPPALEAPVGATEEVVQTAPVPTKRK